VVQKVFLGPMPDRWKGTPDAMRTEWVALASLAALLIIVGVWPAPLTELINTGIRNLGVQL